MRGSSDQAGWHRFFQASADGYDDEEFTQATDVEVVELWALLGLQPGQRLLDVGCGTGRHAVALASRGLVVTGVDLSSAMLERARARATDAGVDIELLEADARHLPADLDPFDVAICLCEGAFCLVADDAEPLAHDRAILTSVYDALRPGGRFALTGLNAARLLAAWHRGETTGQLDLLTLTETSAYELPDGQTVELREHYHLPDGLRTLAESVGFEVEAVWAGGALDWRREAASVDDDELLLLARKPKKPVDG